MTRTEEMWRGRLATCCEFLFLALLLQPGGTMTATSNFKVIGSDVVRAGGTASLTCIVEPYQGHTSFIWVRNGKLIQGQRDMTLSLKNVTKQDAGYYQCGTADSAIDGEGLLLHVFALGDTLPVPHIEHTGVPVCGHKFSLQCLFLEKYIPSEDTVYTWYKDDKEIKGQSGQTLNITKVVEMDAGYYTCTAWEGDKDTTSPLSSVFQLTPLVSPKVSINKLPSKAPVKGTRGGNLTLNCEVTEAFPSVPVDGYTWSFFRPSDAQNQSLDGNESTLFLGPLTTPQSGQYFCEARTNRVFRNLTLAGQASVTVDIVHLADLMLTSDQKVNKGDLVTLTCRVNSHPTARLAWTVNGKKVRHVTYNVDHYVILSAACSDSNNYTCGASNPEMPGLKIHATVQLTVLCNQATMELHTTKTLTTASGLETGQADVESATMELHITKTLTTASGLETGQADVESAEKSWMTVAIISFALLGVGLTAVVFILCWCRRNETWCKMKFGNSRPGQGTMRDEYSRSQASVQLQRDVEMANASAEDSSTPGERSRLLEPSRLVASVELQSFDELPNVTAKDNHYTGERSASLQDDPDAAQTSAPPGASEVREREVVNKQRLDVGVKMETKDAGVQTLTQQRSKSGQRMAPPPQGQNIHFDDVYQKGKVFALPPLQDSMTRQPAAVEGKSSDDEDTERKESKTMVIKRLFRELSKTVCPGDFPVFLFTQALPCHVHAIIYHRVYGVIIVEVYTLKTATRSELKHPVKDLQAARERLRNELQDQLYYNGVTMLLALPSVKNKEDLKENDMEMLHRKGIHILLGTTESPSKTWLQTLFTSTPEEPWRLDGNGDQAFKTAVSKYLSMMSYDDNDDPQSWLVTPEQASVLHYRDKLLHIWGPPGSGKTLLLLDRVRRWLLRSKTVLLAVCGSPYELLLHRLHRMAVSKVSDDVAGNVTLCTNVKQLKKTIESLGKGKNPSNICVAIDAIEVQFLPALLDACRSATVESAWTTSRADFPKSEEFKKLGGRSVRLSYSLRCSGPILQLANNLLPSGANTAACKEFPHASASLTSTLIEIELHTDQHLPASPVNFNCVKCDKWLKALLSPKKTSLTLDPKQWKRWIVLLTGDWGSDGEMTQKLVSWLKRQGIPAVQEWQPDSLRSSDGGSPDKENRVTVRARVESSVDKEGCPAVHVMRSSLFRGLEKPYVLVVHYDWRDHHRDHQSKEEQKSRQSQHQYQLFRAITRCRTRLAVLLLSPSPAACCCHTRMGEGEDLSTKP